MHIPDGFIDGSTALATGAVSVAGAAYAVRRSRTELGERMVPVLGVTAAFVFAAQMINFPVAGGTSGHLLGAVLAAVLLGPWAAVIIMTVVVALQAIGMADGGITALGANVFNMALVGGLGGWLAFRVLKASFGSSRAGFIAAVAGASWLSVVLASAAAALELGLSGTVPLGTALPAMVSVHMIIGIGEAVITTTVIATVLAARPDLVRGAGGDVDAWRAKEIAGGAAPGSRRLRVGGFVAAALAVSLAIAVFVSPFASSLPDGLERVAEDHGFADQASEETPSWTLLPDYEVPGIDGGLAVAGAGLAGTLAVFGGALLLGRAAGRRTAAARGTAQAAAAGEGGHGPGHGALGHRHSGHSHAAPSQTGHGHAATGHAHAADSHAAHTGAAPSEPRGGDGRAESRPSEPRGSQAGSADPDRSAESGPR